MATPSVQGSDAGHEADPLPTFVDIAKPVFAHLLDNITSDAELAEVCEILAIIDVTGALGRPGLARDALLNDIWASVADAAAAMSQETDSGEKLPSLYTSLLKSGGAAPFRLLKKYLTVAGLPFQGGAPHAELLAAIPPKVPPSLIKFARTAHETDRWRHLVVYRRLEAKGLEFPPATLLPESLAIENYVYGRTVGPDKVHICVEDLIDFLEDCSFLRKHTDLEWRVKKAIVVGPDFLPGWPVDECIPPSEVLRIKAVNMSIVVTSHWVEMFQIARLEALEDIVERYGAKKARQLPGLPPELALDIPAAEQRVQQRQLMRRPANDPEKVACKAKAKAAMAAAQAAREAEKKLMEDMTEIARKESLIAEIRRLSVAQMQDEALLAAMAARYGLPPPALRYRCGHQTCTQGKAKKDQDLLSREQFLDHWHSVHLGRSGAAPRPHIDARMLRCGHPTCAGSGGVHSFEGLRAHARRQHKKNKGAPLALLDVAAAYR